MKRISLSLAILFISMSLYAADGKTTEQYLADLSASDPAVQMQAALALGEKKEGKAVPGLVKLLSSQDAAVAQESAIALAMIGKKDESAPALTKAVTDAQDPAAKYAALLAAFALRTPATEKNLASASAQLEQSSDFALRDLAAKVTKALKK